MKSKRIYQVLILSSLLIVALPACKSKQKIAEIPGANTKAATTTTDQTKTTSPVIVTQPSASQPSTSGTSDLGSYAQRKFQSCRWRNQSGSHELQISCGSRKF